MNDLFDGAPRTRAFSEELSRSYLNGSGKYGSMREFAVQLERQHIEALALLRELNDALVIPDWLQARVDALLDRAEAGPSASENDAVRWREHVKTMKAATMPGALLMRFMMNAHGKQWGIEYVLDTEQLGHNTLGVKAVGLAAEQKAVELFAAINESTPQEETK